MKTKVETEGLMALEREIKIVRWLLTGVAVLASLLLIPFYEQGAAIEKLKSENTAQEKWIDTHEKAVHSIHARLGVIQNNTKVQARDIVYIRETLKEIKKLIEK